MDRGLVFMTLGLRESRPKETSLQLLSLRMTLKPLLSRMTVPVFSNVGEPHRHDKCSRKRVPSGRRLDPALSSEHGRQPGMPGAFIFPSDADAMGRWRYQRGDTKTKDVPCIPASSHTLSRCPPPGRTDFSRRPQPSSGYDFPPSLSASSRGDGSAAAGWKGGPLHPACPPSRPLSPRAFLCSSDEAEKFNMECLSSSWLCAAWVTHGKGRRLNLNLTLSLTQTSPDSWPSLTVSHCLRSLEAGGGMPPGPAR